MIVIHFLYVQIETCIITGSDRIRGKRDHNVQWWNMHRRHILDLLITKCEHNYDKATRSYIFGKVHITTGMPAPELKHQLADVLEDEESAPVAEGGKTVSQGRSNE